MEDYIPISTLNDFVFCPYSIYLHNIYMSADDGLYHAVPQLKGRSAHNSLDDKTYSSKKNDIMSLGVYSETLGVAGKIDLYKTDRNLLVERKYRLTKIYRGQYYQLWAEYFCMLEMGYKVNDIAFYEMATNKLIPVRSPGDMEYNELQKVISDYRHYSPDAEIEINISKCSHCIYSNLCDKTASDNVYE